MATTQTRPEFIDTYWIIPEYETTPYGKVSLTLISPLRNNPTLAYSLDQHLKKTGAGLTIPSTRADISRLKVRFFYVRFQRCAPIMAGCNGGASALAGFSSTGIVTSLRLATLITIGERGLKEPTREATTMATTHARPEFIDTYWIIPEYETTPYGKVSLTLISPLRNNPTLAYSLDQHLKKTGAGPASPSVEADIIGRFSAVFLRPKSALRPTMVGCNGGAERPTGFFDASLADPLRLATMPASVERGSTELVEEATTMATAYTRPEFIDTYWIIPDYETTPYGKVSLTLISPLRNNPTLAYSLDQHPKKTGAGLVSLSTRADISRLKVRFFYVRYLRCAPIMVRCNGGASALAGFSSTGLTTPLRLASLLVSRRRDSQESTREATTMATAYTRPEFIDTYWVIPDYETTPYGKVSFTRQDRRTFIAMFKDSRLIWAGRQPVRTGMEAH